MPQRGVTVAKLVKPRTLIRERSQMHEVTSTRRDSSSAALIHVVAQRLYLRGKNELVTSSQYLSLFEIQVGDI